MSVQQILGIVLIATALIDLVLGVVFIGPRVQNPGSRRIVTLALVSGAIILGGIGIALLAGSFSSGGGVRGH